MNIIEAIKSGRKYRRKGEKGWYHPPANFSDYNFKVEAILADDWEVEEISCYAGSAMITREQFNSAWHKIVYCHDAEREDMLKELGL
jgi:hypothetical protein